MKVIPICHLEPEWNFSYIIHGKNKEHSILADPGNSPKTLEFLDRHPKYKISHILVSHKHSLHIGNLKQLVNTLEERYQTSIEVVSGQHDGKRLPTTMFVSEKTDFEVDDIKVTCIPSPCHTLGSMMYYLEHTESSDKKNDLSLVGKYETECYRCVLTGDTHFIGGCGHFCEGNGRMMLKNIKELGKLPKDTFIFPGHEYTVKNLKWALGVEWENEAYAKKLEWAEKKRSQNEYTVPSTVAEEFEINIFWRTKSPIIRQRVGSMDPVEVLSSLRDMKDKMISLKEECEENSL